MNFEELGFYYESTARTWAGQYCKKRLTMHPVIRENSTTSRLRAIHYLEEYMLERCDAMDANRVFDLGCGFGSSLLYASNIRPQTVFSGICASNTEQEIARNRIREAGKTQTVMSFRGDFEDGRNYRVFPTQDLVFAFDSYRHVRDPAVLLGLLYNLLRPSGRLVIADWFRVEPNPGSPAMEPLLDAWRNHAGLSAVQSIATTLQVAEQTGFALLENRSCTELLSVDLMKRLKLAASLPLDALSRKPAARVRSARRTVGAAGRGGAMEYRILEWQRI